MVHNIHLHSKESELFILEKHRHKEKTFQRMEQGWSSLTSVVMLSDPRIKRALPLFKSSLDNESNFTQHYHF